MLGKAGITSTGDLDVISADNLSQGTRMIVEKASIEVVKVVGSEVAEVFELILFDRLKDKLFVVRGEEAHGGFTASTLERIGFANGIDVV